MKSSSMPPAVVINTCAYRELIGPISAAVVMPTIWCSAIYRMSSRHPLEMILEVYESHTFVRTFKRASSLRNLQAVNATDASHRHCEFSQDAHRVLLLVLIISNRLVIETPIQHRIDLLERQAKIGGLKA